MTIPENWNIISSEDASLILFRRIFELFLHGKGYLVTADPTCRILTQRLYGDYRQIHQTAEFKRAERTIHQFKTTGLGKELL